MTDRHERALNRFTLGVEAVQKQRKRETEDLAFQVPEEQWPEDVRVQRGAQKVNGVPIPARPMLSIPKLDQPVQLVLNQEKQAHLGVSIHPLSEDADDDTAETIQGLYRRIETDSRANLARSWAFERAVKAGTGAYRVLTVHDPDGGHPFDQKIVIKRLVYQESAVLDPFAEEPDSSDGRWGFITQWMPFDAYKKKYPKSKLSSYETSELTELQNTAASWVKGEGESRAVLVAEYFEVEVESKDAVLLDDGTVAMEDAIPEGRSAVTGDEARSVPVESRKLFWSTINAVEELEPRQERDGQYIPIIPTIGRELIPFDGERRKVGIIGPNKDAARLFNYGASSLVEMAALETKAPYTMVEGQQEGHEQEWGLANVRNFPYLLYKNVSLNGQPAPPPQRTQVDASRLGPSMMLLQQANDFIHSGTGAFEPTLGEDSSKQNSGRKVLALQQQHDQSTSNWLDNLAEISLTYEAKVILDLIPFVYDRPGRIARILDLEDNPDTVMLNAPYVVDPQTKRPMSAQGQPNAKHFDLKKGRYGVTVSVGRSYKSRTEQGADELGQLFQAEPQLFSILGDIYLKFRDFPGHQEAADRVKKMLPAPLQPTEQDDPAAAQQKIAQMDQQLQQAHQTVTAMGDALKTEQVKHEAQVKIEAMKQQTAVALQKMKDATSLAVAKINALTKGVVAAQEAENEAMALNIELAHDAAQSTAQAEHEAQMAQMQHQQALEQGAAGVGGQAMLAEQGQQHAMAQGEQGQQHALEQGQQAADLAPTPEAGA